MWVYREWRREGAVDVPSFEVGHYAPDGKWVRESVADSTAEAAARVHYLNGGAPARPAVERPGNKWEGRDLLRELAALKIPGDNTTRASDVDDAINAMVESDLWECTRTLWKFIDKARVMFPQPAPHDPTAGILR